MTVGLGLAIEAVYLAAVVGPFSLIANGTRLTDLHELSESLPGLPLLVTASLVGLFVLYGLALYQAVFQVAEEQPRIWSSDRCLPVVLGMTALFSATLIFLYPVTAMDVYNYAVQGHVLGFDGLNPMAYPPSRASGDRFVAFAGSWADSPSPYGPAWLSLSRAIALVAGSDIVIAVLLLKALAAIAVLLTTGLLAYHGGRSGRREGMLAAMTFGWNPLVQLELVGNGHNDAVMICLLVVAFVLYSERRPIAATVALAASSLVKYLTLEALPYFLLVQALDSSANRRGRVGSIVASLLAFGGSAIVVFAPYWVGPVTIERVRVADTNYLSSISALMILLRPSSLDWLVYPRIGILAAVGTWEAYRLIAGRACLAGALFEVSFATILIANHFAGWYLPLLVALAVLAGDWRARTRIVVLTFTTTLTTPLWAYVWPIGQPGLDLATFHMLLVPLTFVPPLVVGLVTVFPIFGRQRIERHPA